MAHKRKDTISPKKVEWAKHLRPFEKRKVSKDERRAANVEILRRLKEEACVDQDFELALKLRDAERLITGSD